MATALETRQALVDRGFVPIPVEGKKPPFKLWHKVENVSESTLAHSTVKCNGQIVGVDENLTRGSVAEYLSGA
jgi:hypothetical protein